ncbi:MAG: type II toxin-antitoxin system VapC family toxin [Coriobacteriaceae bacterium]
MLKRDGMNASQAVNLLFDRLIEEGSADFLCKMAMRLRTSGGHRRRAVDSLSRKRSTRFDDMTKAEIKLDRLAAKGLCDMAQSSCSDTNVVIDYLNEREPYYEKARLLMIGGRVGEFELWISSSQVTDLVYILSNGGRTSEMDVVMGQLRGLRTFVNVFAASEREVDLMLAASWHDPEDYLLYEIALALRADVLITRNQPDFPQGLVPS